MRGRLEPYLRVGPESREPAGAQRLHQPLPHRPGLDPFEFDPDAAPEWRRIGDEAVGGLARPPGPLDRPPTAGRDRQPDGHARGRAQLARVPLRQGDQDMVVEGDITWVPGPSPWPWVLVAVALAAAALSAAGEYRRPEVLGVVALVAVAADLLSIPPGRCSPAPRRSRPSSTGPSPRPPAGGGRAGRLPAAPRAPDAAWSTCCSAGCS